MTVAEVVAVQDLVLRGEAELTTGPFGTQLKAAEYVEDGIPLINVRNVGFGRVWTTDLEYLSEETALRLDRHRLATGDIVFGRKGAVERHAFISDEQAGWIQGSDCLRLRLNSPALVPRFVSYFLLTDYHKQWMKNHCSGAATMASLNQDILGRIELPLLSIPLQHKISVILSAYDDLIENNNCRINLLEEMAQRIYREWFVDFRYPGRQNLPLVDSELGPIPEGWRWLPASEALIINPRLPVDRAALRPYVPMTSLSETGMHIGSVGQRASSSGSKFENGDTLFARITPCLENGKTAYVQCLREGEVASGSTEFIVLRSRIVCPEFTYLLARSEPFRAHAMKSMSGATGRQRVKEDCFSSFLVAVPNEALLDSFVDQVRPLFELSYSCFAANTTLHLSRDLLLPRLISGEVDVANLKIAMPGAAA